MATFRGLQARELVGLRPSNLRGASQPPYGGTLVYVCGPSLRYGLALKH